MVVTASCLVGLVGCLFGFLVDCFGLLIVWLIVCLVGWLVVSSPVLVLTMEWMDGWRDGWLVGWLVGWWLDGGVLSASKGSIRTTSCVLWAVVVVLVALVQWDQTKRVFMNAFSL